MIQRIQSVFLLLAAGAMALLFTKPMSFASVLGDETNYTLVEDAMLADGVFGASDHVILWLLVFVSIALSLLVIFLFKNRPLQMRLSRLSITIMIIIVALAIILFVRDYRLVSAGAEVTIEYGFVPPILAIVLTILALRAIRKDEKLVRSADRLR